MLFTQKQRVTVLGVILVLLLALALSLDTNWLKRPVERIVTDQTDREFHIDGDFHLRPGWPTRVRMERVRFANPEWTVEDQMLQLEQADFRIKLFRLLFGQIIIPVAHAQKPVVDLELGAGQRNNWTLGSQDDKHGGTVPVIGLLTIDEGQFSFHDPAQKTDLRAKAATTRDARKGTQGVKFEVAGRFKNLPLNVAGTGGPILSIKNQTVPYPLDATFRVGPTRGTAKGSVTGLAALAAADLQLDVRGESFADLYPLLAISLPPTPPYRIMGTVIRDGEYWRMHDFAGRVGDSDLSGDVDVTHKGKRVQLNAVVVSQQLDLDDFAGIIGAPPQTGPGETASAAQKKEAAALDAKPRVLPDEPYKLDRLRAMDADITFTGKSIQGRKHPLEDVRLHVVLKDGVLKADPLNFGVAGGDVVSKLKVDARKSPMAMNGDFQFRKLNLAKLYPESELLKQSVGLIGGRAVLQSNGNTFADLLAHGNGTIGLAMRGGKVSNLLLEFTGLDVAEVVRLMFTGDRTVQLRCAVADFDVKDGILKTKSAVIDTTDTNVHLEGTVNLRNETMDLTARPLPKDWSPLVLRSPIHLKGNFKDPDISLDKKLAIRGGLAAILGVLAGPLAALLPLIETGPGKNADCGALIEAVEQHARTKVSYKRATSSMGKPRG